MCRLLLCQACWDGPELLLDTTCTRQARHHSRGRGRHSKKASVAAATFGAEMKAASEGEPLEDRFEGGAGGDIFDWLGAQTFFN